MRTPRRLGINGLGRIGKLTLWYHLGHDHFDSFVINQGRPIGASLEAVVEYLNKDSTYGPLHRYLYGHKGMRDMEVVDDASGVIRAYGKEIIVLQEARNPKDIAWRENGVSVVVECTGKFRDPWADPDDPKGSVRGHLAAGARVVVQSSPFKTRSTGEPLPEDAAILINGINHTDFDPAKHSLVSGASCTTTALAHMMQPLLARDLTRNMITAGMSTVHAVTNSQPVLDAVPAAGATDLRKTRSALNNIILTSTNAAKALEQVMPEVARIGFMADSVRIPTASVSLIVLNATFQSQSLPDGTITLDRDVINDIYREASEGEAKGLLKYSEEQNVSADMLGEDAAVVIEAAETHTRTGFVDLEIPDPQPGGEPVRRTHRIPLTHVKVFGWYDNELGSYTHRLGELTAHVARNM